jgi:hypothetical protein
MVTPSAIDIVVRSAIDSTWRLAVYGAVVHTHGRIAAKRVLIVGEIMLEASRIADAVVGIVHEADQRIGWRARAGRGPGARTAGLARGRRPWRAGVEKSCSAIRPSILCHALCHKPRDPADHGGARRDPSVRKCARGLQCDDDKRFSIAPLGFSLRPLTTVSRLQVRAISTTPRRSIHPAVQFISVRTPPRRGARVDVPRFVPAHEGRCPSRVDVALSR